jgi:hypothetical protein
MCGETIDRHQPGEDEYVLDTPTVRCFVSSVRGAITRAAGPAEAVQSIRPLFSRLLADEG